MSVGLRGGTSRSRLTGHVTSRTASLGIPDGRPLVRVSQTVVLASSRRPPCPEGSGSSISSRSGGLRELVPSFVQQISNKGSTVAAEESECSAIAAPRGIGWHWLALVGRGVGGRSSRYREGGKFATGRSLRLKLKGHPLGTALVKSGFACPAFASASAWQGGYAVIKRAIGLEPTTFTLAT